MYVCVCISVHLQEASRIVQLIEAEGRMVVGRSWGKEVGGIDQRV